MCSYIQAKVATFLNLGGQFPRNTFPLRALRTPNMQPLSTTLIKLHQFILSFPLKKPPPWSASSTNQTADEPKTTWAVITLKDLSLWYLPCLPWRPSCGENEDPIRVRVSLRGSTHNQQKLCCIPVGQYLDHLYRGCQMIESDTPGKRGFDVGPAALTYSVMS